MVKLALRLLWRRPAFTAVALITLALGIGAPTAIFSIVRAVLLRPLPYHEPDRIVRFRIEASGQGAPVAFDALPVTTALEWGSQSSTLAAMGVFNDTAMTLSSADGPFRLSGITATPNIFELLGVAPERGRTFDATSPDAHQIVISHDTWQRYFHADGAIVGSSVNFDGVGYRIAGVMPDQFRFPTAEAAFWVPLVLPPGGGRGMLLPAIARMRPGVTLPDVLAEGRRVMGEPGDSRMHETLVARTLQEQMVGDVRRLLWVLMAAVSFVFVIATANIALLLLTRGASREREFSVRLALGAGRGRLIRQLFVEGMTLAVLGGAAGLLLAHEALRILVHIAPPEMPRLQEASLDTQVLMFATMITLATSVVFGILSAGRTITIDPIRALAGSASESRLVSSRGPRRRLNLLAAGELALTMVLLVAAGLLLRSFVGLVLVDQGFNPGSALAFRVSLPAARYPSAAARMAFHERLLDRLKHADPISSAGIITAMPNRQATGRYDYNPDGPRDFPDPMTMQIAEVRMASEGFFEAMGIPVLAGRAFRAEDTAGSEPVMIISQRLARLHFPGVDPIGKMLYSGAGNRRVVGVVSDVRPAEPGPESSPAAYLPIQQDFRALDWLSSVGVVVRGGDPRALATSVRGLVLSLDPEMPPSGVRTLEDEVSSLVAGPRFSATVLALFAVVALVMAAVGVYGVMAYSAGQRTREIGVRIALGATRRQVLWLMLTDGVVIVAAGLGAGLVLAVWLAKGLTGLLHEVAPADPVALASVALLLSVTGIAAAYVPARRATRVSVLTALREDG
jgi:putative ABC transport system permease protein